MVYNGHQTSTTPGTPVRLASAQTMAAWLTIQPRADATGAPSNTSAVVVGGKTVAFNSGLVLLSGDAFVSWPVSDINWIDLREVWMDVITSGDGVQFVYGVR